MKLKGLALFLLVLFPFVSYAQSITVTGIGNDGEGARHDAYRKAIEAKIGTVLVSEKESQNYKLLRNSILAHSAGYITQMKILNESVINGVYKVEMEIEVSSSKLADIVLSNGKTNGMSSDIDHARVSTFMHQKNTGDKLLNNVLKEYPQRAYDINYSNYTIKYDTNRNIIFSVPYQLTWNYKFLSALTEVFTQTQDGSTGFFKKSPSQITVMAKDPERFLIGKTQKFSFNDDINVNLLYNRLADNEPRIRLTVFDKQGMIMVDECATPDFLQGYSSAFYGLDNSHDLKIYGNNKNKNTINLGIHNNQSSLLNEIQSIKLQVISKINCKF